MTEDEARKFVESLSAACETHTQWITLIRFGMGTLIHEQEFLMMLIGLEAVRMCKPEKASARYDPSGVPAALMQCMNELGLRVSKS